jgi:hypothetical protein
MGLFGRRLPSTARPKLERNERVLAWATTADGPGTAVVVTTFGVWLPGRPERLSWHRIHRATWAGSKLTVVGSVEVGTGTGYRVMADDTPVDIGLVDPRDVPAEIRTRVTKSVAYTAHHPVSGGGVRVVARRAPGVNGVEWHVRYDAGTDATNPEVIAATEEFVAELSRPDPDL